MVHHPVPVGRGADQAALGIVDKEIPVGAVAIGFVLKFLLQTQQFVFQVQVEPGAALLEPLALLGALCGNEQVGKGYYPGKKIIIRFHVRNT